MAKKLFLFTDSYPYGRGEQYLDNEMPYLIDNFDKIYFVPINIGGESRFDHPKTEILNLNGRVENKKTSIFKFVYSLLSVLRFENKYNKAFRKKFTLKERVKTLYNAFLLRDALINFLDGNEIKESEVVLYSYWFYHWSLVASLVKEKKQNMRAVSRAHLGDLYLEFEVFPFFSAFKLSKLDNVVVISKHAKNYFAKEFPNITKNVELGYLGVAHKGINPNRIGESYTIVSCSSVRKEKCLDKIAQVVKSLTVPVKWIHFGDGPEMDMLKKEIASLPENIEVDLKGWTKNSEVMEFYKSHPIDLFVNLSYEEGVPVSLMEAISFGIPVLGTNVYGTPEVANQITGDLVETTASVEEIARVVVKILVEPKNKEEIIKFWDKNFNSDNNYSKFVQKHLLAEKE